MSPLPLPVTARPVTPHHRDRIAELWDAGRNTHEIAVELRLHEAAVAAVVRQQREMRLAALRIRERMS